MNGKNRLVGERFVIDCGSEAFPENLAGIPRPPKKLYGIGDPTALQAGLAVIGARKATPYGKGCARRFARLAAEKGVVIISGGARGCDSEAHRAALSAAGRTVAFLGGGCDELYPASHFTLFQRMVDAGGAVVSEQSWDTPPLPYLFRERNRLIAGLAEAVLIVEAGLPSGTFSTADEALDAGREVLVVPGSITSPASLGSNRLLFQGATPIVDDESFEEVLFRVFGLLRRSLPDERRKTLHPLVEAVRAEPLGMEQLYELAVRSFGPEDAQARLMELLVEAEAAGVVARHPSGKWGPAVKW
jgi:DNA processing protein